MPLQGVENPYWQYFCGCSHFEHEPAIDSSLMTRWRQKVKAEGMEKLLEVTVKTGFKTGALKRAELKKLSVDTTVQEKAISFPTDAKLYQRMREKLVSKANGSGIVLRQSYVRKGKQAFEGNPFDGHTLSQSIEQAKRLASFKADEVYVDRGYNIRRLLRAVICWLYKIIFGGWFYSPAALRVIAQNQF